jgi:acetoin utilization deacetylase AcuC-like enzyme
MFELDNVLRLESARQAGRDDLLRVHETVFIDRVASTAGRQYVRLDPDTHTCELSYETALYAAGGLLDTIDAVMDGRVNNGFAMVRPPGHHAESDRAMGFCLFNNVAIGARYLLEKYGLERVLVVDWDVHHGNGTQRSFYDDNRVLFISTHQYPCYPGTGPAGETGSGDGAGYTVNIPLPPGCGDAEYAAAFDRIVCPVARAFKPQFVLVSAGFDAHRDDPFAGMYVTEAGYTRLTSAVLEIAAESAGGRIAAVLEGGYNLEALASSVTAVVSTLGNGRQGDDGYHAIEPMDPAEADALLEPVLGVHSGFWRLPARSGPGG